MPLLNIEKFPIRAVSGILCAMELGLGRNLGQDAGPGNVHRDSMSRRRRCAGGRWDVARCSTSRCTAGTHKNALEEMKETKDGSRTTDVEPAVSLVRGAHRDALACAEGGLSRLDFRRLRGTGTRRGSGSDAAFRAIAGASRIPHDVRGSGHWHYIAWLGGGGIDRRDSRGLCRTQADDALVRIPVCDVFVS
jgi:hypothetical protein